MPLICLVNLELAAPDTPAEVVARWRQQRQRGEALHPEPAGNLARWRGKPETRDWDGLQAAKQRDGYRLISHKREFVEADEKKDEVEFAGT